MAVELARPGTLYLALQGDQQSGRYINVAVDDGVQGAAISESRARPPNAPAALQTTISAARSAARLQTNDQMRAHHLIPANVWGENLDIAALASQAGWQPDSKENIIPLPANEETQAKIAAKDGFILPIHNSSHPNYDWEVRSLILAEKAKYGEETLTPAQARAVFEKVAKEMEGQIRTGRWMPRLH
jgi:hypothetical protein